MNDVRVHTNYFIEFFGKNAKWVATGEGPMSFSAMTNSQTLPESVWKAYVDYLNAREPFSPNYSHGSYRLTCRTIKTEVTSEVIHV